MITVKKLVKRFGPKVVLRGLDFEVESGEFVALLGPNGAGKTTFLRILSSLSRPVMGTVNIAGYQLPNQAAAVRRRLGVVSHLPLLYGDLTAEENLRFYGRMYSISEMETRITEVLEMVGLALRRRDLVRTFSRGMQQRLAIGRAVLHDPEVMLFDEPHTGLDQDACEMLDTVLKEVAARGRTVVMTSHDLARTADLASRFDVLSKGKIVASARKDELERDQILTFYREALQEYRGTIMKGSLIRATFAIVRKDLAAEWRSRELFTSMLIFSLLVILIFNFALELDPKTRTSVTAGVLWVTFTFAGTLGLNRSMAVEKDRGCMDGLLLAPVDRSAIYFGKAISNLVFMLIVEVIVLPVYSVLYNANLFQPGLLLVILLGSVGYVAVGTLLSAMAVQTRTRDVLLPILLFPLVVPVVIAAVKASGGILQGLEFSEVQTWINLLLVYDVIFIAISFMFFEYVVEE